MNTIDNTINFKNNAGTGYKISKKSGPKCSTVKGGKGEFKKMAAKGAVNVGIQKCSY